MTIVYNFQTTTKSYHWYVRLFISLKSNICMRKQQSQKIFHSKIVIRNVDAWIFTFCLLSLHFCTSIVWLCFGLYCAKIDLNVHCFLCTHSIIFSLQFSSCSSRAILLPPTTTWHQNFSQITLLLQLAFLLNTIVKNKSKWKQLTRRLIEKYRKWER